MNDGKPYQLQTASNHGLTGPSGHRGSLGAQYDEAGNLTAMVLRREGNMAPFATSGWQRFAYAWDEVGRLMSASRWDLSASKDYLSERSVPSRKPTTATRGRGS